MKDQLSTKERLAVSDPNQNNRSPNNLLREFHNDCPERVLYQQYQPGLIIRNTKWTTYHQYDWM